MSLRNDVIRIVIAVVTRLHKSLTERTHTKLEIIKTTE